VGFINNGDNNSDPIDMKTLKAYIIYKR